MGRSALGTPIHDAPDDSEGSPARVIATMVAIVAILMLGSLFWSALGALLSAGRDVAGTLPAIASQSARPTRFLSDATPGRPTPAAQTPGPGPTVRALAADARASATPTSPPATATPSPAPTDTPQPTPTPAPSETPTPAATADGDRAPWVLLPQPAPGARVSPGPVVVEARGRGAASVADIRLELDGTPLPVSLEQRSEVVWRGSATVQVGPGHHTVKATVVDARGRTGSYRWSFDAGG